MTKREKTGLVIFAIGLAYSLAYFLKGDVDGARMVVAIVTMAIGSSLFVV